MLLPRTDDKFIYFYQLFVSAVGNNVEKASEGGFWCTIIQAIQIGEAILSVQLTLTSWNVVTLRFG